jgi:hypothetical protein
VWWPVCGSSNAICPPPVTRAQTHLRPRQLRYLTVANLYGLLIRKAVAKEVLRVAVDRPVGHDDITPKLGTIFKSDLEMAASEGRLPRRLFNLVHDMFLMLKLDTQEIEGINGLLKRICDMAPAISPDLLAARILAKKTLQVNHNTPALREKLIQECVEKHRDIKAEFDRRNRKGGVET